MTPMPFPRTADPTDEQVRAYADMVPDIYRCVLQAFPAEAPDRRAGDGLSSDTLDAVLTERMPVGYRSVDLRSALDQLERRGFIKRLRVNEYGPEFCSPTPLGERLITAVTGHRPAEKDIPPLPEPTWG